ncbi:hypothetical protein VCHC17A1_4083A, partial [Vibrio cholerae HC-17A1]
MESVRLKK